MVRVNVFSHAIHIHRHMRLIADSPVACPTPTIAAPTAAGQYPKGAHRPLLPDMVPPTTVAALRNPGTSPLPPKGRRRQWYPYLPGPDTDDHDAARDKPSGRPAPTGATAAVNGIVSVSSEPSRSTIDGRSNRRMVRSIGVFSAWTCRANAA